MVYTVVGSFSGDGKGGGRAEGQIFLQEVHQSRISLQYLGTTLILYPYNFRNLSSLSMGILSFLSDK